MTTTAIQQQQTGRQASPLSRQSSPKGITIQAKLTIGQPNDKYEQEADHIADQVMRIPDRTAVQRKCTACEEEDKVQRKPLVDVTPWAQKREIANAQLQREENDKTNLPTRNNPLIMYSHRVLHENYNKEKWATWCSDKNNYQKRESMCEGKEKYGIEIKVSSKAVGSFTQIIGECSPDDLARKLNIVGFMPKRVGFGKPCKENKYIVNSGSRHTKPQQSLIHTKRELPKVISSNTSLESRLNSSKSGGSPLPDHTRSFMENRIGGDFSNVKIHTDSNAVKMSQELGAQAFTHGNHIYFNSGKYNPDSFSGKHLLAHEMVHTVQQGITNRIQKKNEPIQLQRNTPPWIYGHRILFDSENNVGFCSAEKVEDMEKEERACNGLFSRKLKEGVAIIKRSNNCDKIGTLQQIPEGKYDPGRCGLL